MDEVKKYPDTEVFCDHRTPIKLQEKFIRPIMLYDNKCWAINKQHVHKMNVVDMRILWSIGGE